MLNPNNVSWSGISISSIENMERPLYTFNNFMLKTQNIESDVVKKERGRPAPVHQEISGDSFVVAIDDNPPYFHFMYDVLMQYEFLRRMFPGLKLYFVHPWPENVELFLRHNYVKVIHDIVKAYGITYSNILPSNDNSYTFEKMHHFLFSHNPLLKGFIPNDHFAPSHYNTIPSETYPNDHRDFFVKARKYLTQSILPYINTSNPKNNKVFISRKIQPGNNPRASEQKTIAVENFFRDRGYQILYNEGLSLFEQAQIYYDASHIAGFKGSNFVNIVFCRDETEIIAVANDDQYTIWYDYVCDYLGFKYSEAPYIQKFALPDAEAYTYTIDETLFALQAIDV